MRWHDDGFYDDFDGGGIPVRAYIKVITSSSYWFTVQDPHVLPSKVSVYSAVLQVYKV